MTVSPAHDVMANEPHEVNVTCDAGLPDPRNISLVSLLLLSKVLPDGSVKPLVEVIPGSQLPVFLEPDSNNIRVRTQVNFDLNVNNQSGVFLSMNVIDPKPSDTGVYRCSMSYVGGGQGMGGVSVDDRLQVWTWQSLLGEIDRLKAELKQLRCV